MWDREVDAAVFVPVDVDVKPLSVDIVPSRGRFVVIHPSDCGPFNGIRLCLVVQLNEESGDLLSFLIKPNGDVAVCPAS
jgi:hypothetical protein